MVDWGFRALCSIAIGSLPVRVTAGPPHQHRLAVHDMKTTPASTAVEEGKKHTHGLQSICLWPSHPSVARASKPSPRQAPQATPARVVGTVPCPMIRRAA